jgi:hypothetical protein
MSKRFWLLPSLVMAVFLLVFGARLFTTTSYSQPLLPSSPPVVLPVQQEPQQANTQFWMAVGDTGSGTVHQKGIAKAMTSQLQKQVAIPQDKGFTSYPVLMLGDLIYPVGDYEKLGKPLFTDMYAPLLANSGALKPAVGNHDIVTRAGDSYRQFFGLKQTYYAFQQGAMAYIAIDTNDFNAKQQQWLEAQLKAYAAKPWVVVFAHHPVLSSGDHGNNVALQKTLLPLLQKYGVALYLAGHDHNYERFNVKQAPLLVVSGGGGAYIRPLKAKHEASSAVAQSLYHYLAFESNEQFVRMVAFNEASEPIDCVILKHKPQFNPPTASLRLALPKTACSVLTFSKG